MQTITPIQLAYLKGGGQPKAVTTLTPEGGTPIDIDWTHDVVEESFVLDRNSAVGRDIEIGCVDISQLQFELYTSSKFNGVTFEGAKINLAFDLAGSVIQGGVFTIAERPVSGATMRIRALDNLIKFSRDYVSDAPYPRTLASILDECCTICGVTNGVGAFLHDNLSIQKRPDTTQTTHQQMVGWIAAMAGKNAYVDETGTLRFRWYDGPAFELKMNDYFDAEIGENDRQITGLKGKSRTGADVLVGTESYVLDLSGNPFLEDDSATRLTAILGQVGSLVWRPIPYLETVPLPHIWPGDKATLTTDTGTVQTIVSSNQLATTSLLVAAGEPITAKGFASVPSFSAKEQQEIIDVIHARKIIADAVVVPGADETLDETLVKIQEGEIEIRGTIAQGGENLLRNPTFGTTKLTEKTGWSTGQIINLLKARFPGATMAELLVTLQGKTIQQLINYDY